MIITKSKKYWTYHFSKVDKVKNGFWEKALEEGILGLKKISK